MATYTENNVTDNTGNRYFAATNPLFRATMFTAILSFLLNVTGCTQHEDSIAPEASTQIGTPNTRVIAQIDSNATLKSVASFPVGAAFNSKITMSSAKANQLFAAQFNAKTVHAYMNTEPAPGKFNLTEVDLWVKAAEKQSLRLHGHSLVYHMAAPEWFTQFKGNTGGFENAVKNHIQTIVGRYRGKIKSWDVINEIFDTNSGTIRNTAFRQLYASDAAYIEFVKRCFQWAHESDPNALLFYNDFNLETSTSKVEAVVALVNSFKKSGTPIDGIGTQMHVDISTSNASIRNAYQRLAATGLLVHVSELDIAVNPKNDPAMVFTKQLQDAQADKYQTVAALYKQNVPARLQYGITLWSFSDADSWLVADKKQRDMPNVFDAQYEKKEAYFGLLQGLK